MSTYIVSAGVDATASQSKRRPARPVAQKRNDDFAAVKSGLDSTRSAFYGQSGRMPNATTDQTRRQYNLTGGSGDRHLTQLELWTEREISRHLSERSSIFSGMVETWAAEVIQCGFKLKPATGDADLDVLLKELLFGWDGDGGWFGECDARGLGHFWDLMTLAEETEIRDGDHAFYLDPAGNNGRGSVMIIEGDRILTPYGYENRLKEGWTISNGIVWNETGYPVLVFIANVAPQYSFCSVEQGDFYPLWRPWRAAEGGVVLSIQLKRATSTRRQPWLSTAVRTHDEVDDVFVAIRIAMRNEACRATYTKISDWDAYKEFMTAVDPSLDSVAPVAGLEHTPNPGDHVYFNPGEEGGVLESNKPGNNFESFINLQLTTVGLPLGMCLEEAVKIFQKSFSASRMAVEGTRRRYERRQRQVKRRKVVPILQFAIARLQAKGLIPNDDQTNRVVHQILCGYPGWPYMEPLKDAQASKTLVEAKLRSRRTCATEIGDDYDTEIPLMQEEEVLWPAAAPAINPTMGAAP